MNIFFIIFLVLSLLLNDKFLFITSIVVLSILFFLFLVLVILFFRLKGIFDSNKLLHEEQIFKISENFIEGESESGKSKIDWDKVFKVSESKKLFAIYISKEQAFLLPKIYFTNNKYNFFINVIKNKLDKKQINLKISKL